MIRRSPDIISKEYFNHYEYQSELSKIINNIDKKIESLVFGKEVKIKKLSSDLCFFLKKYNRYIEHKTLVSLQEEFCWFKNELSGFIDDKKIIKQLVWFRNVLEKTIV
jgi:hypothetical protein